MTTDRVDIIGVDDNTQAKEEDIIDVEDSLLSRRQELRELRNKLTGLRRSAKSADKKTKKDLQAQVAALEEDVERKKIQLEEDEKLAAGAALVMEKTMEGERVAAARAKRQAKKEARQEEEARRRREADDLAFQMPQLGREERETFEKILCADQLQIHNIDPDGNCLFNAIAHQLALRHGRELSQTDLRNMAAEHIQSHNEKYAAFLEEPTEEYCLKIRSADLWGGHLELDALSEALATSIIVYQSDTPPMEFNTVCSDAIPLRIWYDVTLPFH